MASSKKGNGKSNINPMTKVKSPQIQTIEQRSGDGSKNR